MNHGGGTPGRYGKLRRPAPSQGWSTVYTRSTGSLQLLQQILLKKNYSKSSDRSPDPRRGVGFSGAHFIHGTCGMAPVR